MSYIHEIARESRAQERELRDPILGDCGACGGQHLMDRETRTFISGCQNTFEIGPVDMAGMESAIEMDRRTRPRKFIDGTCVVPSSDTWRTLEKAGIE